MKKTIKVTLILIAFNLLIWSSFAYSSNDLKWFNDWIVPNDDLTVLEATSIILYLINNLALLISSVILVKK